MIIDAHVHFPAASPLPEREWGAWLCRRAALCGIDALVVSDVFVRGDAAAGAFPSPAAIRRANAFGAEQARLNPGKLYFLAYLNPQNPDWEKELRLAAGNGAVGVKLWVALKDARGDMDNSAAVLRKAAEMDLPVVIHVFNRAEKNGPGEIHIAEFSELSLQVPECRLIGAHSGANFRESTGFFRRVSANTFWDISGTNPDCSMMTEILREIPPERVLFGSDAPGRSFVSQLHKVTLAPLSERAKALILGENAAQLFRLPEIGAAAPPPPRRPPLFPDFREDHFIFCGRWPFFEKEGVSPAELEKILERQGTAEAYTASFESIFRLDLLNANREFRRECAGLSRIRPLAVADPEARNLTALLDDAAENNDAGVWFSPALLGQAPDSPAALAFYRECRRRGLRVYLNCRLGESRFRHRALHLRDLGFDDLKGFFAAAPEHDYVIQGAAPRPEIPRRDCRFTIEKLTDTEEGLSRFLDSGGGKALVPGSEYPFREPDQVRLASEGKVFRQPPTTRSSGR